MTTVDIDGPPSEVRKIAKARGWCNFYATRNEAHAAKNSAELSKKTRCTYMEGDKFITVYGYTNQLRSR